MDDNDLIFIADTRTAVDAKDVSQIGDHLDAQTLERMNWRELPVKFEHGFGGKVPMPVGRITNQYFLKGTGQLFLVGKIDENNFPSYFVRAEMRKGALMNTSLGHGMEVEIYRDPTSKKPQCDLYFRPKEMSLVDVGRMKAEYGQETPVRFLYTGKEFKALQKDPRLQAVAEALYKKIPAPTVTAPDKDTLAVTQQSTSSRTITMADQSQEPVKMSLSEEAIKNVANTAESSRKRPAESDDNERAKTARNGDIPDDVRELTAKLVGDYQALQVEASETKKRLEEQDAAMKARDEELKKLRSERESFAQKEKEIRDESLRRSQSMLEGLMEYIEHSKRTQQTAEEVRSGLNNGSADPMASAKWAEISCEATAGAYKKGYNKGRDDYQNEVGKELRGMLPDELKPAKTHVELLSERIGISKRPVPPPSRTAQLSIKERCAQAADPVREYSNILLEKLKSGEIPM